MFDFRTIHDIYDTIFSQIFTDFITFFLLVIKISKTRLSELERSAKNRINRYGSFYSYYQSTNIIFCIQNMAIYFHLKEMGVN